MKNNKGITMIEIVVVIIILIILAVIAIWNTWASYLKAEGTSILTEFESVEKGAIMLETFYNTDENFEFVQYEHYCEVDIDDSGDAWYVIYGKDYVGDAWYNAVPYGDEVYETIIRNWGLDNLNRSYEVNFGKKIRIRFANDNYLELNNFKVYSYDDIKSLRESGAF